MMDCIELSHSMTAELHRMPASVRTSVWQLWLLMHVSKLYQIPPCFLTVYVHMCIRNT